MIESNTLAPSRQADASRMTTFLSSTEGDSVRHSAGLAERVGFEPTLRFLANTLSKRAPSATRPPLREAGYDDRLTVAGLSIAVPA